MKAWELDEPGGFSLDVYEQVLAGIQGKSTGDSTLDAALAVLYELHQEDVLSGHAERAEADMRGAIMQGDERRADALQQQEHARVAARCALYGIGERRS